MSRWKKTSTRSPLFTSAKESGSDSRRKSSNSSARTANALPHVEKLVDQLLSGHHPLRHLRRVQGILRLSKRYPITPQALDHACQRALSFNKTRLAYIKDCALYFVAHGQRPTLLTPQRKPDCVHLHQYAANSGADSELSSASVEEELL